MGGGEASVGIPGGRPVHICSRVHVVLPQVNGPPVSFRSVPASSGLLHGQPSPIFFHVPDGGGSQIHLPSQHGSAGWQTSWSVVHAVPSIATMQPPSLLSVELSIPVSPTASEVMRPPQPEAANKATVIAATVSIRIAKM
jgi:hypothetical protein